MLLSRPNQSSLIDLCVNLFIVPYGTVLSLVNVTEGCFSISKPLMKPQWRIKTMVLTKQHSEQWTKLRVVDNNLSYT